MKILCIGDVVGSAGCGLLRRILPGFKRERGIDLVIANGENSAEGNGITPASANSLLDSGVDLITGGNHSFRRREIYEMTDSCEVLLRPANYPAGAPGRGLAIVDLGRVRAAVLNVMGTVYMDPLENPFFTVDALLETPGLPPVKIVDFHAEATGEKRAMAYHLDGRVSVLFGTHTHVQTADEQILPGGTGYITDLGMTGAIHSVLGMKPETILSHLRTRLPSRHEMAKGPSRMDGCLFTVDEKTGQCLEAERISLHSPNFS